MAAANSAAHVFAPINPPQDGGVRLKKSTFMARGNRTGGPKTQLGKLASSKNPLKTGVDSAQQIFPGERQEDFEELHQIFWMTFNLWRLLKHH